MPELPEVEMCRRQLERWLGGHTIVRVTVADPAVVRRSLSSRPGDALPGGAVWLESAAKGTVHAPIRHGKRFAL